MKPSKNIASGSRPLSPHLQVYRPQITSMLSILHRITGLGLCAGALLLTCWIGSATYGAETFYRAQEILTSLFGQLILLSLTIAFYYHLANGIRHLAWDVGWGFEINKLNFTGIAVILFTIIMTSLTFLFGFWLAEAN